MLKGATLPALGSLSAFSLPAIAAAVETNSTTNQRPRIKITDVRTAQGPQTHVRVCTDQGIYGQGEVTDAAVGTPSLMRGWRHVLIGRDPLTVEAIWRGFASQEFSLEHKASSTSPRCQASKLHLGSCGERRWDYPCTSFRAENFGDKVRTYCDSDMENPTGPQSDRKLRG